MGLNGQGHSSMMLSVNTLKTKTDLLRALSFGALLGTPALSREQHPNTLHMPLTPPAPSGCKYEKRKARAITKRTSFLTNQPFSHGFSKRSLSLQYQSIKKQVIISLHIGAGIT